MFFDGIVGSVSYFVIVFPACVGYFVCVVLHFRVLCGVIFV